MRARVGAARAPGDPRVLLGTRSCSWGVFEKGRPQDVSGPEGAGEAGTVQRKQQDALWLERRGGEAGRSCDRPGMSPSPGVGVNEEGGLDLDLKPR